MTTGYVSEIFCSIQGEGPLVGQRQVFFRTGGCSATCRWCDTVYGKVRSPRFVIHGQDGEDARTLPNPVASVDAAREVLDAARRDGGTDTVSITGGEPLEQGEFVVDVARRCKEGGLSVYLETNGLHDVEFAKILPYVDVVAMDIKLPSATGMVAWKRHEAFLARLAGDGARLRGNGNGAGVFSRRAGRSCRTASHRRRSAASTVCSTRGAKPPARCSMTCASSRRYTRYWTFAEEELHWLDLTH